MAWHNLCLFKLGVLGRTVEQSWTCLLLDLVSIASSGLMCSLPWHVSSLRFGSVPLSSSLCLLGASELIWL